MWDGYGLHGEGIKVAIIDTGIDYTHANFGGPGTVAAYDAAHAASTLPADPALFGPAAPRSRAASTSSATTTTPTRRSADYQPVPHPDPNPLDCNGPRHPRRGHGGRLRRPRERDDLHRPVRRLDRLQPTPGRSAPASRRRPTSTRVRVFGCDGSTDVTVDAIDWAVDNDMDVINMSLGSPFGRTDDPSAVASTNAAKAGVIVVTSAGNGGPSRTSPARRHRRRRDLDRGE